MTSPDPLAVVLARVVPGGTQRAWVGPGWQALVLRLDRDLAAIDPDYRVLGISEKYASLRFCFEPSESASPDDARRMEALVDAAEEKSERTCETCGPAGAVCERGRWLKTLCPAHAGKTGYTPTNGWTR